MDGSSALPKCACGTHGLSARELADLPRWQGVTFCFTACIDAAVARWQMQQKRLGFDLTVGAVEDIDIAELAGA